MNKIARIAGIISLGFIWGYVFISNGLELAINQSTQFFWSQQQTSLHTQHIGSPFLAAIGFFLAIIGVWVLVLALVLVLKALDR